jgi:hypothetical protein
MQKNKLPTKSHVELEDNSIIYTLTDCQLTEMKIGINGGT